MTIWNNYFNDVTKLIIFTMTRSSRSLAEIDSPVSNLRQKFRDDPNFSFCTMQHYFRVGKEFRIDANSQQFLWSFFIAMENFCDNCDVKTRKTLFVYDPVFHQSQIYKWVQGERG